MDIVKVLEGVCAGNDVRYTCAADETFFDGFKKGDIVRVLRNTNTGDVLATQKIFTFDNAGASASTDAVLYYDKFARKNNHASNPIPADNNDYSYGLNAAYGRCIATGDGSIAVTFDGGDSSYATSVIKDAGIYIVEYTNRGVNVTRSALSEILVSSSPVAANGHSVLLSVRNSMTREIFIIKKN